MSNMYADCAHQECRYSECDLLRGGVIKNQRAIEDTLDRMINNFGAGRIIKVQYTSFADAEQTVANKGYVLVQRQYGPERKYIFDVLTHGMGKTGLKFLGRYRVARENV